MDNNEKVSDTRAVLLPLSNLKFETYVKFINKTVLKDGKTQTC